mgnify:CR=1 FL=1
MATARRAFAVAFWVALSVALLGGAARSDRDPGEQLHRFTARLEFDFVGWTLKALGIKLGQDSLSQVGYLKEADRADLVRDYLGLVARAGSQQGEVERIYADPTIPDPEAASAADRAELAALRQEIERLKPAAEAILQEQASVVLAESGLTNFGAPFPPVAFHSSKLPMGLVVSPRSQIRQDALITLLPDLTIEQQVALEQAVESQLGLSALVVQIGGIGTYPTMVEETTALDKVLSKSIEALKKQKKAA